MTRSDTIFPDSEQTALVAFGKVPLSVLCKFVGLLETDVVCVNFVAVSQCFVDGDLTMCSRSKRF